MYRSASALLEAGGVRALAVAIFGRETDPDRLQDPVAIAQLLLGHGFSVTHGWVSGAAVLERLREPPQGTTTLLAVASGLGDPPPPDAGLAIIDGSFES